MSWFRLDDQGAFHAKVLDAGNEAYGAWCRAGQWSCAHLTEGLIPKATALLIAPPRVWKRLIESKGTSRHGLVTQQGDDFQMHDFLDWNPSAAEELAKREARSIAGKRGGLRSAEAKAERSKRQARPQATAQAIAQPIAQANGKQNSTPSPSPSPIPIRESEIPTRTHESQEARSAPAAPVSAVAVSPPRLVREGGAPLTPAPDDIALDDEVLGYCGMAGTPVPTKDHVLKFLSNARSKGLMFADWRERFKLWMLEEKKRRSQDISRTESFANGGGRPSRPVPYHRPVQPSPKLPPRVWTAEEKALIARAPARDDDDWMPPERDEHGNLKNASEGQPEALATVGLGRGKK